MPRWRIVHVLFSSRIAGSERYCADLANRQAAMGHDVHVISGPKSPLARILTGAVKFHQLKLPLFRNLRVRRIVARMGVDICHGHLSLGCKVLGAASKHFPTVATLHVGYKPHQHLKLSGLICVNQTQRERLGGYAGQVRVIPNWLPMALANSAAPGSFRRRLGLSTEVFLIGAVGRLHASKGMDLLVSAFRTVAPAGAALVIMGAGPQLAKLKKLRAGDERIRLLGYREDVGDCLGSLDLFVSPSREESFGLAIIEAMNAGVPIIATAAEGPREFLRKQPVQLITPGSLPELAVALSDACSRFRTGRLPRVAYDMAPFDPTATIAKIMGFYRELIGNKRSCLTKA